MSPTDGDNGVRTESGVQRGITMLHDHLAVTARSSILRVFDRLVVNARVVSEVRPR